jgi:hypothetical protein
MDYLAFMFPNLNFFIQCWTLPHFIYLDNLCLDSNLEWTGSDSRTTEQVGQHFVSSKVAIVQVYCV